MRQVGYLQYPELEQHLEELRALHTSRKSRLLNVGFPTGKRVAEAAAQDMSVRSRCVEIAMNAALLSNGIGVALDTIGKYVGARYYELMKEEGYSGVNDRKALVSALLNSYQRKHEQILTLIKISDMVIKDVDQSSYSIKAINDALIVATKREFV